MVARVPGSWCENPGAAAIGYEPWREVEPELARSLAAELDPGGLQGGRFARRGHWIEP